MDSVVARDLQGRPQYDRPQTHADRIRAMTDEELAEFLQKNRGGCRALTTESYVCDFHTDDLNTGAVIHFSAICKSCWLDWLRQEVDNEQP